MNWTGIIVALIAAFATVSGSVVAATSSVKERISAAESSVAVLQERQSNQYKEVKEGLERIELKIDKLAK